MQLSPERFVEPEGGHLVAGKHDLLAVVSRRRSDRTMILLIVRESRRDANAGSG